jgi:hypothetical protein
MVAVTGEMVQQQVVLMGLVAEQVGILVMVVTVLIMVLHMAAVAH